MPDGPATRPKTPLAVENGVGKPAAPARGAPNAGSGKREWRTPTLFASVFALALLGASVSSAAIIGVHVGPVGVGIGGHHCHWHHHHHHRHCW